MIEQLGEEWPEVDVGKEVERDREPEEGELRDAIGGEGNFGLLGQYQLSLSSTILVGKLMEMVCDYSRVASGRSRENEE